MPAQHLCGGLRWLTEDATDQLFAHAQPRQVVIAPDMLSAALCMPKLVARLAVSEAALQRLHGSPSEGQPEAAQPGSWAALRPAQTGLPSATEAGQDRPASAGPGKQLPAASCRCALRCGYSAEAQEQCQIGQILGLNCSAVCREVAWDACFEVLEVMLAWLPMAGMPEGDMGCAQHCASMAESLRSILKGLPVSSFGAATTCLVARATSVVAARHITRSVRLSQPPCLKQCLLRPPLTVAAHHLYSAIHESLLHMATK